jgi:hypothetical protein
MSKPIDLIHLRRIKLTLGCRTLTFRLDREMLVDRNETLQTVRRLHDVAAGILNPQPETGPDAPAQNGPGTLAKESDATADHPPFPWDLYDGLSSGSAGADPFPLDPDPSHSWAMGLNMGW